MIRDSFSIINDKIALLLSYHRLWSPKSHNAFVILGFSEILGDLFFPNITLTVRNNPKDLTFTRVSAVRDEV